MNMFREAVLLMKRPGGEKSASLQLRLFAFFALFIFILALSFTIILMLSGVFFAGKNESRVWLDNELAHISENASNDLGKLSREGTVLAEQLSLDVDAWLADNGTDASHIADDPNLLVPLLSSQTQTLLTSLRTSRCSGAFIMLDATVNPELDNAAYSRAGLFFKRTEPNAIDLVSSKLHYLRGPASIARENGIELLGQWQMEFNTSDAAYYKKVLDVARENPKLPLSRLYYWSERVMLDGNSESGMLLCVPLISGDGTVYGVCGLEMSSMLFKLGYSPDNSRYPRIFATLSPESGDVLDTDAGLVAGNSYLTNPNVGSFNCVSYESSGIVSFNSADGAVYAGMKTPVKLYPSDSPYSDGNAWSLAVMMPGEDYAAAIKGNNALICAAAALLLLLSLLLAVYISKRYISPVVAAIDVVKSGTHTELPRTNILEIDDLLEYLSERDADAADADADARVNTGIDADVNSAISADGGESCGDSDESKTADEKSAAPILRAYHEFVHNIETLSAAERAVFNLYMKGYTAKEIAEILCLSINTIKTHNKRIYMKLNVASRKELMVYVQMMASDDSLKNRD